MTRRLKLLVTLAVAFPGVIGYLAIQSVSDEDSYFWFSAKLVSKALVMNALHAGKTLLDEDYLPTPIDGDNFTYANLSHPKLRDITTKNVLEPFRLNASSSWTVADAIAAMDTLRSSITVGTSSADWSGDDVDDMFEAGLAGESFLCGDIARMYILLLQSKGLQARKIGLNRADGIGHVVVEIYDPYRRDWVLADPTNNLYFAIDDRKLNALELHHLLRKGGNVPQIDLVFGGSSGEENSVARREALLDFYRHGIVVEFYNKWAEMDAGRINPVRSPSIMGVYVGTEVLRKIYYRHDFPPAQYDENKSKLYKAPALR